MGNNFTHDFTLQEKLKAVQEELVQVSQQKEDERIKCKMELEAKALQVEMFSLYQVPPIVMSSSVRRIDLTGESFSVYLSRFLLAVGSDFLWSLVDFL